MDSQRNRQSEDENAVVFQDLTPEKPANAFQKRVIQIQQNWPSQWDRRHRFILMIALGGLLIAVLLLAYVYPLIRLGGTAQKVAPHNITSALISGKTSVWKIIPYESVLYFIVQTPIRAGVASVTLEAVNVQTGKLVWSYARHDLIEVVLVKQTLYVRTNTSLRALNATTRAQLWETSTLNANASNLQAMQTTQNVLFVQSQKGLIEALNASTGAQLWQLNPADTILSIDDGTVYVTPSSEHLGVSALDAVSGKLLWYNAGIYQNIIANNGMFYLQDDVKQAIEAFNGRNDALLWTFDEHNETFAFSAANGFIFLSNSLDTTVEVLNGQSGKLLWQRQGTLDTLVESPQQTVISSVLRDTTEIVRTADGKTLYSLPSSDLLLTLEDQNAIFTSDAKNYLQTLSSTFVSHLEAIRYTDRTTTWTWHSAVGGTLWPLQNNTFVFAPINGSALLLLRADNGQTLWQYKLASSGP